MATVTLTNLAKTYPNGFAAIRGVSLSIADGEFVVLVGPSGCGKSTTLRLIAGLEEDFTGDIAIGGRSVSGVPAKDRDIAMVFQNYALYPHMSVRRNMEFALRLRKLPKAEITRRVAEAARMLGLEELLDRKPGMLSGGQRQRVAVGRAVVREPQVFLFDEPLSNLDAKLRVTTRAEIKALHARLRTTTIYVTHDQEEAMTLGDRIVLMHKGEVQQAAPPLEMYRRPSNRFVAAFIGTPPMNLLDGTITRTQTPGGPAAVFVEGSSDPRGAPYTIPLGPAANFPEGPFALGLRPQALSLTERPGWPSITLPLHATEPLGDTIDLFMSTPRHPRIVARVPVPPAAAGDIAALRPGDTLRLFIDPAAIMLFEPGELGKRVVP